MLQNKVLHNEDILCDFKVPIVADEVERFAAKCQKMLVTHKDNEMISLLDNNELVRRRSRWKGVEILKICLLQEVNIEQLKKLLYRFNQVTVLNTLRVLK